MLAWIMWRVTRPAVLAALLLLGLPGLAYFVWHESPFMGSTFTPEAWAQAGSCSGLTDLKCETKWQNCERGAMFRTLTKDHLPLGRISKAEVVKLLGNGRELVLQDNMCLRYQLGYCSGLGADMDYMQLCFDANSTLTSKRRFQG